MSLFRTLPFFILGCLWLFACNDSQTEADYIIQGKIWTGVPDAPFAEAMAISGDSIIAVGSIDAIDNYQGSNTQLLTYSDRLVTPGFIDTHVHFLTGGFRLSAVQLRDAATPEEFINRIGEFAQNQPEGTWILGGDWDHENWGGQLPDRRWIDSVTQDHPVWVTRLDGHMSLANSLALELAEIKNDVADVDGGEIVREGNRITGIFKDNATGLVSRAIPDPDDRQKDIALDTAMRYVLAQGVTTVHDVSASFDTYERARDAERLRIRVYAFASLPNWKALTSYINENGRGNEWLYFGGLKGFVDGSLGSHTAAFFEPYTDQPSDSGFFVNDPSKLYEWISDADSAGLQVAVHAIGDRAINELLNIYEAVEEENGARDRRFRIEHAQHIRPEDIHRFAELNVIPSMQPYHAIDDGRWAEKLIGPERIKTTYAFRSLLESNARLSFGSDWFVAPPVPLAGIYAAVTRRTLDNANPNGWVPEQKISLDAALRAYTSNASYAGFSEGRTGQLKKGMLADFVVLDKDLFSIPPEEIINSSVLETWVGGKRSFESKNF